MIAGNLNRGLVAKEGGFSPTGDHGSRAARTVMELLRQLHETRSRGYSILSDAAHDGIAAVAAPVRHALTKHPIAVLVIAGPHVRLTNDRMLALGPEVIRSATELAAASAGSALLRKASVAAASKG